MIKQDDMSPLKILLAGDSGTGKTNLVSRFIKNQFDSSYQPTCGVDSCTYDMTLDDTVVNTELWDLAGGEKYCSLANSVFGATQGILLVYDISNYASFENIVGWLEHANHHNKKSPPVIMLLGNKNDLEHQREVPRKEAEGYAMDHGMSFMETSALNENCIVAQVFQSMIQEMTSISGNSSDIIQSTRNEQVTNDELSSKNDYKASSDTQSDDTQEPFKVVLVDIRKAAEYPGKIHCVEKPLEKGLAFVALSYRWGEVQEQCVDTHLGYVASIHSFHLNDFYQLCQRMLLDADLKHIEYVWVDAICVDQMNHARRKATIYQMSNIYTLATYILAVPDLHLQYLRNTNKGNTEALRKIQEHSVYIYSLLHKDMDQLARLNDTWFLEMGVPEDAALRSYLLQNKEIFVDSLQEFGLKRLEDLVQYDHTDDDAPMELFRYIQDAIRTSHSLSHHHIDNKNNGTSFCSLCFLQTNLCEQDPSALSNDKDWLYYLLEEIENDKWKKLIVQRAHDISMAMEYLCGLVADWSSRVWVISEYHIAKHKQGHKLKFWFMSLVNMLPGFSKRGFFEFNFDDDDMDTDKVLLEGHAMKKLHGDIFMVQADMDYTFFKANMFRQLNQQSFLEMMLKSKASRNEDRFYAVMPNSEYKSILTSKDVVSSWHIDNIISVKLKLFEIMNTKDKLDLLYVTGICSHEMAYSFPNFVSIDIEWPDGDLPCHMHLAKDDDTVFCNFDLEDEAAIQLTHLHSADTAHSNCVLKIMPKIYFVMHYHGTSNYCSEVKRLWKSLQQRHDDDDDVDDLLVVCIPMFAYRGITLPRTMKYMPTIYLFGNFEKNKWLIVVNNNAIQPIRRLDMVHPSLYWETHETNHTIGFNIF